MEPSDAALIQACRRGDASAWEHLVDRYQRLIYSIPRRSGLGEDLAADVFQHVWATLCEKLDQIEQPDRIGAWLVTTARRETWRVSRQQRGRTVPVDETDDTFEVPDGEPLPDDILVRLETQHAVRAAVDQLDERCRMLLMLLYFERDTPSYAEIAARLGTSEGSIGPTRARCFEKLRRILDTTTA
jgi:RNA polymerase sigma factor (sigma-70 family)